jgi:hypothetical protein
VPGKTVTWLQFSTAVRSEEALAEMLGGDGDRTMFTIHLSTGRARIIDNYSLAPQEMEILLPPNSRFDISAVLDRGDGLWEVQLNEVKSSDPILSFGSQGEQLAVVLYVWWGIVGFGAVSVLIGCGVGPSVGLS